MKVVHLLTNKTFIAAIAIASASLFFYFLYRTSESRTVDDSRSAASANLAQDWQTDVDKALELGQVFRARNRLEERIKAAPDEALPKLYLGQLFREAGETRKAEELWKSIDSGSREELATSQFLLGSLSIEQSDIISSRNHFLRALELNPEYTDARERLIAIYRMLNDYKSMLEQIEQIRERRPLDLNELVYRTIPEASGYPPSQTIQTLQKAITLESHHEKVRVALAAALRESGQPEKSLQQLAAEEGEFDLLGENLLSMFLLNEKAKAIAIVEQLEMEAIPAESLLRFASGKLEYQTQHWHEAARWLIPYVRTHPYHYESCYLLGLCLSKLNQPEQSRQLLEYSVELDALEKLCIRATNENTDNHNQLSEIARTAAEHLVRLRRIDEAVLWLNLALLYTPNHAALSNLRNQLQGTEFTSTSLCLDVLDTLPERLAQSGSSPAEQPGEHLPVQPDSTGSEIVFDDVHASINVHFQFNNGASGQHYLIESMGGGVLVVDADKDCRPDLYFLQGSPLNENGSIASTADENPYFRNHVSGVFKEATQASGMGISNYSLGGAVVDFDNDGFDDVIVSNLGANDILKNNGDGTFTPLQSEFSLPNEMTTSIATADFNSDGFCDIYSTNYLEEMRTCRNGQLSFVVCDPAVFEGQPDRIWTNNADDSFTDDSEPSGIIRPASRGLGVVAADFDNDGRMDIYVANDGVPNFLFHNISDDGGRCPVFDEVGLISGTALDASGRSQAGMGIAVGDMNRDARIDLYVTNFFQEPNSYYENSGELSFIESGQRTNLMTPSLDKLGFGAQCSDFNADGLLDIIVANGHIYEDNTGLQPWKMTAQLYSQEKPGQFTETSAKAGPYFMKPTLGRAVAILDYNMDLMPDVVIVHQDQEAAILKNNSSATQTHRCSLDLIGTSSNRNAVGTRIDITEQGHLTTFFVNSDGGYLAANSRRILFDSADEATIQIRWPSGLHSSYLLKSGGRSTRLVALEASGRLFEIPE
ncbi:MAG: VCBS repeat-containing protein [Planctomycetaceae bacterium]|nr:VCBS repeat-containing protein [Planctomycetaceae bacterium]